MELLWSALTLTDLVFKRCRDIWFGVVLLFQSISITTRFVCVEISQSNNRNREMCSISSERELTQHDRPLICCLLLLILR